MNKRQKPRQPKVPIHWSFLTISMVGVAVFANFIFLPTLDFLNYTSVVRASAMPNNLNLQKITSIPTRYGLPVRIKIPIINVNAKIEQVGLTLNGSMGVPKDHHNAAWYKFGARPGEQGSAVMAGHLDWWRGATAVFADLHKLKPGDVITVEDEAGALIPFVVRSTRVYNAGEPATNVFVSGDGLSHLNLVTCSGVWNKKAQQYAKRLVVFADRQ